MKLISVTAIGAFQRATKDGYQRVIRKKYNKAEFQDISQLFPVFLESGRFREFIFVVVLKLKQDQGV